MTINIRSERIQSSDTAPGAYAMKKIPTVAQAILITLGLLTTSLQAQGEESFARKLSRQIFNNAIGGSQGGTGINPFTLGTDDFHLEVARNGNPALLTSPGFVAGAAGLNSRFSSQAGQGNNGGMDPVSFQLLLNSFQIFNSPVAYNVSQLPTSSQFVTNGFYYTPPGAVPSGYGFNWCGPMIC